MASNWAIVIGINQYRFLQPLHYAKRDAEAMCNFLTQEARFDRIFLFTDDSPPVGGKPTEPFRANLLRVLRQIFAAPFMKDGDNFWFFFSGHGIPHNGQDYLMPLDGDPEDIENTGISTNTITNYLRSCGADNAVMILDACRSGGKKSGEGIGRQTEADARQTGVISLFSCSPDQYSYELEAIGQGAFTYALLEGLGIRGRCATVERLNQYLEHRVPELVSQHLQRARQIPYTIAEPLNRSHLILMPQHASLADIATLKNDAYRAERKQDWELAQRLWIRVNAAASGQDMEAIEALQSLGIQRYTRMAPPQPEPPQTAESSKASSNPTTSPKQDTAQRSTPTTPINSASTDRPVTLINKAQLDILQAAIDAEEANPSIAVTEHHIAERVGLNLHEIRANLRLMERWNCVQLQNLSTFNHEAVWVKVTPEGYMALQGRNEFLNSTNPTIEQIDEKINQSISFAPARSATEAEPAQLFATTSSPPEEDNLSSERFGTNYYTKLRDLLKARDWKAADQETAARICEVIGRENEGWLWVEDVQNFPCQDLRVIDQLWVKYSQGKFGFSVQKKIYVGFGANLDGNYPGDIIWKKFGDRVGWRENGKWLNYSDLNPSLSSPHGNFPCCWIWGWGGEVGWVIWWFVGGGVGFFHRVVTCKL